MFIATFARPTFAATGQESLSVVSTTDKPTDKTTDKTTENAFPAHEKAILALIAANPSATQKEMGAALGLSEDGIRYHMEKLKAKGLLRREGGKKAGRWEICMRDSLHTP
jgi:ATP-dependent DNA helicase RecG